MAKLRRKAWQGDVSHRGARYRQGGFLTKIEAEAWELETKSTLIRGGEVSADSHTAGVKTLGWLRDQAIDRYWKGTKDERNATANADDVVDLIGDIDLKLVTTSAVDAMIRKLKGEDRKCTGATINRKLAALSRMLHLADSKGWISKKPHLERQKESLHRIRWYTAAEEACILNWFKSAQKDSMYDLVEFLVDTGARLSEALDLSRNDVDGDWVIFLDRKNGTDSRVPLTPRARAVLQRRSKLLPGPFSDIDVRSADYEWRRMRNMIGMANDKQFLLHTLRHTYASRLVQRGVDLMTVSKLLGHKSMMMTMRYAHLAPNNYMAAIGVLSADIIRVNPQSESRAPAVTIGA